MTGQEHSGKAKAESFDCLVLGAGIAGLLSASLLNGAGFRVCVLEKGRGVGGRMATRRKDGAVFDHGAQFFTVRDPEFQKWVEGWKSLGLVKPWYEYGERGVHFRGVPGMTAIAKHLARDLDVRREVLVRSAGFDGDEWTLQTEAGISFCSKALLLTAPIPQSLALLDAGQVSLDPNVRRELEAVRYQRCIAALAILDRPSALTANDGALQLRGEPVQWIGDNHRKGVSPSLPSVTIHSTPAFADAHWDIGDSVRIPKLLAAAAPHLQANVVSFQGHRWGFSAPVTSFGRAAYVDRELRLAMAGDGLTGGRVEGAALSGIAAAGELASVLT